MAMIRYGNQAFEWSHVYAVRVLSLDFNEHPNKLAIFSDYPSAPIGEVTLIILYTAAERAWNLAIDDPRLTKFDKAKIAIDMSKVVQIVRDGEKKTGRITLVLGKDRGGTFDLDADAAQEILDAMEEG